MDKNTCTDIRKTIHGNKYKTLFCFSEVTFRCIPWCWVVEGQILFAGSLADSDADSYATVLETHLYPAKSWTPADTQKNETYVSEYSAKQVSWNTKTSFPRYYLKCQSMFFECYDQISQTLPEKMLLHPKNLNYALKLLTLFVEEKYIILSVLEKNRQVLGHPTTSYLHFNSALFRSYVYPVTVNLPVNHSVKVNVLIHNFHQVRLTINHSNPFI